jgi:Spy/CpxP family protein refolding chaperone
VNSWKVILATVVIFGAGVLTGGLLVNYVDHSHPRNFHRPPSDLGERPQPENAGHDQQHPPDFSTSRFAERMNKQFVQQLNDTLQLTPEQREKIAKILTDGQEQNRKIWTSVAPKMFAVMQDVNRKIRAELTPAQQKDFEELLKKYMPHHPPPGTNEPSFLPPTNLPPPAAN